MKPFILKKTKNIVQTLFNHRILRIFKMEFVCECPCHLKLSSDVRVFSEPFQGPSSADKNCSHPVLEKCYLFKANEEYM